MARMADVGCLAVCGALCRLQQWAEARGTFPNPPMTRVLVVFEGVPHHLCDDEGLAFLARGFGHVEVGTLVFSLFSSRTCVAASILVAIPSAIPTVLFVRDVVVVRLWVLEEPTVMAFQAELQYMWREEEDVRLGIVWRAIQT